MVWVGGGEGKQNTDNIRRVVEDRKTDGPTRGGEGSFGVNAGRMIGEGDRGTDEQNDVITRRHEGVRDDTGIVE